MKESHEEAGEEPAKVGWTEWQGNGSRIERMHLEWRVEGEEEDRD